MQQPQDLAGYSAPDSVDPDSLAPKPLIEAPIPYVIAGLLVLSGLLQFYLLTAALAVLLALVGVAKLWSALSMRSLRGSRRVTYARVFPDDKVELLVRLENRKALPLPWVEIAQPLPRGLREDDGEGVSRARGSILWHQAGTFRLPLNARKRGYYLLPPSVVSSGDPLGVFPQQRELRDRATLTVYPRVFPISQISLVSSTLFGDVTSLRRLLYDPTNSAGSRDYAPGDPLRHIHWKATAKRQHHQVKVFEPSTNLDTVLLLAVDSFQDRHEDDLELGISAAASLAVYINAQRSPVGLLSNARMHTRAGEPFIQPRMGEAHLAEVLEALALVSGEPTRPFLKLLDAHLDHLPRDTTLVLIHAAPPPALNARLQRMQANGYRIVLYTMEQGGHTRIRQPVEEHGLGELLPMPSAAAGDTATP